MAFEAGVAVADSATHVAGGIEWHVDLPAFVICVRLRIGPAVAIDTPRRAESWHHLREQREWIVASRLALGSNAEP
jgi:hypothetical protein